MPFLRNLLRNRPRRRRFVPDCACEPACLPLESRLLPSADVLTYHNDNMRTGVNPNETELTLSNVNVHTFGKVGQVQVDGQVYAQPLYKSDVFVPGKGMRDVVYVATAHDSVYAFDAHSLQLLWKDSFINPARGITTIPSKIFNTTALGPEIGIVGTPVIDPSTRALYVVVRTLEISGQSVQFVQRLHALELGTGREKMGGPVTISAAVPGTGEGSVGGWLAFNPLWEFQRSGLLLSNGVVYIAWASQADQGPYHGWVIGYDSRTLRQVSVFVNTPDGKDGGIWMSGGAPAADAAGNIYLASGNGTFDANTGGRNYSDSLTKHAPGTLQVLDYFTPFNQDKLEVGDWDFGSGGVVLLPDQPGLHRHLMFTGAKEGRLYLIDRDNLGRFNPAGDNVVQSFAGLNAVYATPAVYNGIIYYVGTGVPQPGGPRPVLLALKLANGRIVSTQGGNINYNYPGSTPSISGNHGLNGIVWTVATGGKAGAPAILRVYAAGDVTHEIYDSTQAGTRDTGGPSVKFAVPTVANGRVYIGGTGTLTVYGLLPK